jgi:hypothetical protein
MTTENPTWGDIKKWAEAEIEKARTALEVVGTTPADTEQQRARIVVMRELIALKTITPLPVIPGPVSYA